MFRENMHPPRTNPQPINIEIDYSCELSHANGSSMIKEKSEKSKKSDARGSSTIARQGDHRFGALSIALCDSGWVVPRKT